MTRLSIRFTTCRENKFSPIIALIILLISSLNANAQGGIPSTIEWQKCYGVDSWYGDEGTKIVALSYGQYAAIGKKTLQGYETIWASKLNYKGEVVWETNIFDNKQYVGFKGTDIIQNYDGGFTILGRVLNPDRVYFNSVNILKQETLTGKGYYDNLVVRLNAEGQMIWAKVFGGSGEDIPTKILQTPDSNLLLLSYTSSTDGDILNSGKIITDFNRDLWLAKINHEDGSIISKKCIGGNGDDIGLDMKQMSDGGYAIVGYSTSNDEQIKPNNGGKDLLIIKIDAQYNVVWKKTYGGTESDEARKVLALPNGELVVGVTSNSFTHDFEKNNNNEFPNNYEGNMWLFKLNSSGDIQYKKILGGAGNDILNDLIATRDGNYLVAGSTKSNNGNIQDRNRIPGNNNDKFDAVIMKATAGFDVLWSKTTGGSADDEVNGIVENEDGTIVALGITQSFDGDVSGNHFNTRDNRDIWLFKLYNKVENNCTANITTSNDWVAANVDLVAGETIITSDRVKQNSSVHYGASKSVDITDGFDSEVGNVIEFNLNGCAAGTNVVPIDYAHPIQMKAKNACREGGVKMKFFPFTPNTDISQYRMSVQNFTPNVEYSFSGNTLIAKNNAPNTTSVYFALTISKDGHEDFVYQGYANTCDHDNESLNCPENDFDVLLDREYYQVGDTFTATWTGVLQPNQALNWYNSNVSEISKSGNSFTGRIDNFPVSISPQAGPLPDGTVPCHGAIKVELRRTR